MVVSMLGKCQFNGIYPDGVVHQMTVLAYWPAMTEATFLQTQDQRSSDCLTGLGSIVFKYVAKRHAIFDIVHFLAALFNLKDYFSA